MIRVLVVDDQALVRAGFRVLLESAPDIEVVGEAENGRVAVEQALATAPDLIRMDIRMPEIDGLEATRQIAGDPRTASTRVIILTTFDLDEYVFSALRVGASGFLLKDTEPEQLLDAVRVVATGEALLAPSITRRLIAEFVRRLDSPRTDTTRLADLTEREREVLALIGRGLNNQEIADELVISPATAKTHVGRVMSKLEARDRSQLVVIAYETGLVEPRVR